MSSNDIDRKLFYDYHDYVNVKKMANARRKENDKRRKKMGI